ncbi:MAG: glycosyltransferase family 4 protein [Deltaproteobacteria bacterium]|nr:glycosyltransferase family 4 protein [Deltaproteobacteria bacterium]
MRMGRTALVMDARMVGPRLHGIARHVVGLARALVRHVPEWRPTLLLGPDAPASLRDEFTHVAVAAGFLDPVEAVAVPAAVAQLGPRLFHAPSFSVSPLLTAPFVVTLHDAIHLQRPQDYGLKQRAYYLGLVRPATRRARLVLTVSQDARSAIFEHLRVPLERIRVVPNGVEPALLALEQVPRTGAVLVVTGPKPHKNLVTLLHAVSHAPQLRLDVAGTPLEGSEQLARALGLADRVRFLGPVDEGAMVDLLQRARVVAVPSTLEGFGLPVLEGMAVGAPVVCSDIPVFHEVAGGVARYVPPLDAVAWARALLEEPPEAASRQGRERAACMTWEQAARLTAQVYEEAAGASPLS